MRWCVAMTTAPARRCRDTLTVGEPGTNASPPHSSRTDIQTLRFQTVQSSSSVPSSRRFCTPSSRSPDWLVEVGETLRHNACKHVFHQGPSPAGPWCPGHTLVHLASLRPPHQSSRLRPSMRVLRPFPCLCTSCAGRTPDLWRAQGPGETESEPGACSQTSWQRYWCTPAAG